jgi:hypothetical protein
MYLYKRRGAAVEYRRERGGYKIVDSWVNARKADLKTTLDRMEFSLEDLQREIDEDFNRRMNHAREVVDYFSES